MKLKKLFATTAIAVTLSGAAHAASVTYSTDLSGITPQANPLAVLSQPITYENITGSQITGNPSGNTLDAWTGTVHEGTGLYSAATESASLTYNLAGSAGTGGINLLWGSVDNHNLVEFLFGGSVVDSLTGTVLTVNADVTKNVTSVFARILSDADFDQVRFSSGQDAFEFGNVTPVPLPASALLLLLGVGGLGALRKRKAS